MNAQVNDSNNNMGLDEPEENFVKADDDGGYLIFVDDVFGLEEGWFTEYDGTMERQTARMEAVSQAKAMAKRLGCDWGANF
jgi:hypothetical protein